MELKGFVENTLMQIIEGVHSAQEKATELGACVSPKGYINHSQVEALVDGGEKVRYPVQRVHFEVVLTRSNSEDNKGGIGVFLGGVGIGGQAGSETKHLSLTNVKFSVAVLYPCKAFNPKDFAS